MKKGPLNKSINNGYGTVPEVEMESEQQDVSEPGAASSAVANNESPRRYSSRSFSALSGYVLTHVELATLPLLPALLYRKKRLQQREQAALFERNETIAIANSLGKAALPSDLVSLLEGVSHITEKLFPAALLGLLLHDVITFYTQVDNRYGTTLNTIFLGTANNALAWSSIYGTDIASETLHGLIPAAVGLALSVSALSQFVYDRYRLNVGKATEDAIHTEMSIRFLRHTALWQRDTQLRFHALNRLSALSQAPGSLSQRFRALAMIEQVASSFQPNHQLIGDAESLYSVALHALNQRAFNSENSVLRNYARYLCWSLGEATSRKMNALLLPFTLISLILLAAKLRLIEMWWTKARELADYLAAKKSCEQDSKVYTLTQSGNYECTVCGDWPEMYYGDIQSVQACLTGLFASARTPDFILNRLSASQERLSRYSDFSVIDLSKQDLATKWSEPEWEQFFTIFEAIPHLHLALFNLSTPALSPDHVTIVALQRLATFMKRVPIDGLDVSGQDLSIANFNVLLEGFVNNTQLNVLRFSNTRSSDASACALAAILPSTRIKTLISGYNNVTDYGMDCYTTVLPSTQIHTFYIPGNYVGEQGMVPFVNNLHKTKIRQLDISNMALTINTTNSLGQQLSLLSSLQISHCLLSDDHLSSWPTYALNSTTAFYDFSDNNYLTSTSILPFLAAHPFNHRFGLSLAGLINLNNAAYQRIGQLLATKNINVLDISRTALTCARLISVMANNSQTQLHTLIASRNKIADTCMSTFSQRLATQTNPLRRLDLSENAISSSGFSQLLARISDMPLRVLNLASNQLTGVEFSNYPHAISQSQLTELNIGNNVISAEFIPHLLRATLTNTTLQKLDLRDIALTEANGLLLALHLLPPIPHPDSLTDVTLSRDQQRLLHDIQTSKVNETHISELIVSNAQMGAKGVQALCHAAPVAHLALLDVSGNTLVINTTHQCSTSGASRTELWPVFHLPRYVYRTFKEALASVPSMIAPVAASAILLPSLTANSYSAPMNPDLAELAVPTLLLAVVLIKSLLNSRRHHYQSGPRKP